LPKTTQEAFTLVFGARCQEFDDACVFFQNSYRLPYCFGSNPYRQYPLPDVGALQVVTDDQPMKLSRLDGGDMAFLPERGQNANVFGICFRS
jgi:hypothetical protein